MAEQETKNRYTWEAKSEPYTKAEYQKCWVMDKQEVLQHFIDDGKLNEAIGKFVTEMLNKGYAVTILDYGAEVSIDLLEEWWSIPMGTWCNRRFRTRVKVWIDFRSDPECFETESPLVIAPAFILLIAKAIALIIIAAGIYYALQNLTTTKETYEKYGYALNPNTGEYEWKLVEKGEKITPPEFWGDIIFAIIIGILILVGVLGSVYVYTGRRG